MGTSARLLGRTLTVALAVVFAQCFLPADVQAQGTGNRITVHVDQPGIKVSPVFYGLMTEEINHAYDGGLYAELLQNRSFRDRATSPVHWSLLQSPSGTGSITLESGTAVPALKIQIDKADAGSPVGVTNDGYWGVPVRPSTTYHATLLARASSDFKGPVTVALRSTDQSRTYAEAKIEALSGEFKEYRLTLRTAQMTPTEGVFVIEGRNPGTIWLQGASLFPPTYKGTPNGNRIDIMEKLADLKPSFLRLPGGNYLEGDTIPERFDWKATLGNIFERPGHQGPWGYRSSDGLGLLEYLRWCEDLRMEPVLAVYAGFSLRGAHVDPGPALQPYVQDALDEIEYTIGGSDTKWGAERAKDGHPRPFPLHYVEIGNEDNFDRSRSYGGRYKQFYDAIKAKYPTLQIIATTPIRSMTPDVLDDHYYRSATEMERDSGHYDSYSRTGPKIFVGEWASIEGRPTPTYQAAMGDASWLIGLERNSDLVVMESYAPLLVNVNPRGAQWPTNLIGYDGLSSYGSPAYYVQSLYAHNTGDRELPVSIKLEDSGVPKTVAYHGGVGVGTWLTNSEYKDAEVVANGQTLLKSDLSKESGGWRLGQGNWAYTDGALRQTGNGEDTRATADSNANWTDYTYHVKARKVSGAEGFLVLFHVRNARDYWQWNIGGWGNSRSAIQRHESGDTDEVGEATNTTIETGRWYDVTIETHGNHVKCFLDGKLITEVDETPKRPVSPLYVGASKVTSSGEVILKIVNVSDRAITTDLDLQGLRGTPTRANGWQMTGNPEDQNSIESPTKVAPKPITLSTSDGKLEPTLPPYSITILRIRP